MWGEVNDGTFLHLALDRIRKSPNPQSTTNLHTVSLVSTGWQSFETFRGFAQLPAVRFLKSTGMDADGQGIMLMDVPAVRCRLDGLLFTQCSIGTELLTSVIKTTQGMRFFGFNAKSHFGLPDMSTVGANLSASAADTPKFLQLVTCRSVRRRYSGYPSLDSEFYSSDDEAWDEEVPAE